MSAIRLPRMLRLAEHPVEAMVDAFARLPLLGPQDWMKRPAPSERWGNRAVAAPADVVDIWRRWAAEAVVVQHAAWRAVPRLDDDQRWALLRDVAALIEVAAMLDRQWAASWTTLGTRRANWRSPPPPSRSPRVRSAPSDRPTRLLLTTGRTASC